MSGNPVVALKVIRGFNYDVNLQSELAFKRHALSSGINFGRTALVDGLFVCLQMMGCAGV